METLIKALRVFHIIINQFNKYINKVNTIIYTPAYSTSLLHYLHS